MSFCILPGQDFSKLPPRVPTTSVSQITAGVRQQQLPNLIPEPLMLGKAGKGWDSLLSR